MAKIPLPLPPSPSPFPEDAHATEFYADNIVGMFARSGNMRLTFEVLRVNPIAENPISRVAAGRVIIPIESAEVLEKEILSFLEKRRQLASQDEFHKSALQSAGPRFRLIEGAREIGARLGPCGRGRADDQR
jgi:hypothetical protein